MTHSAHPSFPARSSFSPRSAVLRVASAAALLVALNGAAASAQSVQLSAAPAGQTVTTTAAYPTGDSLNFISGPFTVAAGTNSVTYTAANTTANSISFESFNNYDGSLDFPVPTQVVATFNSSKPTGPLLISFGSGVTAFGIKAEAQASDIAAFSFTVYNSQAILGQYTLPPVDQTQGQSHSVFLGAQATGGNLITGIEITSIDTQSVTNDFYVGPLSVYSPVPEASTTVSFGLLLVLGVGAALVSARRRSTRTEMKEQL